ncbi:MAG: hypothetical protein AAB680_06425, partial [Pseudomonadota bacterium]
YSDLVWRQYRQLEAALAKRNIKLSQVFWEDDNINWAQFDLITPLMAWNYPQNLPKFLACLDEIQAANIRLANPQKYIRDNFDKGYLVRLAQSGAPVPPTLEVSADDSGVILSAFDKLNCDEIIIKPRIGAGAWRQARLRRGENLPKREDLPPDFALIQPFIESVGKQGELSILFMGGEFSHALMKTPKAGDYRTQTRWGAREFNIVPPPKALTAAKSILSAYDKHNELSYARIDLVEADNGDWLLMEMEIIEPYLYGPFDGHGGELSAANFANAIAGVIEKHEEDQEYLKAIEPLFEEWNSDEDKSAFDDVL